jgi:hypothetical protein
LVANNRIVARCPRTTTYARTTCTDRDSVRPCGDNALRSGEDPTSTATATYFFTTTAAARQNHHFN